MGLMTRITPWFERKFPFPIPAQLLPNVLARLRGTPARVEETFRGRPRELLIAHAAGRWSAQEHAGHLLDLEPLWLARVDDYVAAKDQLTAADLTNRKTHEANHNSRPVEQILAEFRSARKTLLKRVDELQMPSSLRVIPHPRLGAAMGLIDHLYFVAEHDDHHLAAISELLNIAG
jgi:uncharacterized damage-inducible protein DinB